MGTEQRQDLIYERYVEKSCERNANKRRKQYECRREHNMKECVTFKAKSDSITNKHAASVIISYLYPSPFLTARFSEGEGDSS